MNGPLMTAKGVNGEIDLLDDRIRIRRKGVLSFMTQGIKGDKEILISNITSIQFKKAGLTNGYIQFAFMGGQEAKGGVFQATKDENTVMFKGGKQQRNFTELKEKIDSIQANSSTSALPKSGSSNLDELEKLASLKERGIITEEEFNAKKRVLLEL